MFAGDGDAFALAIIGDDIIEMLQDYVGEFCALGRYFDWSALSGVHDFA